MRPTLADYMRDNALKMESAELAPVTEIVAPVTIPDGVAERSRDHLILLPSPAVASTVEVGIGEGDAFQALTPEQIGVSTINGDDAIASAIAVRDRKLAGELRIRYVPVDVAMESDDKPFVQLGTVVEPGSENKNPFPANAPTEEPAEQVTNQPTVDDDKGELEDKAKIAENAVDQSVAPKVNVTVVEKGAEARQQDDDKVVDANDGNTGERKAEATAKETELKGPKEEAEVEDNAVNSNGEDPDQAAAEVDAEQKNDDAEAGSDNAEETDSEVIDENAEEDDEDEEEEEELKQEGFKIETDIQAILAYAAEGEDDGAKKGMLARAMEALAKFINRIKVWLNEKVFSKLKKKGREDTLKKAKSLEEDAAEMDRLKLQAALAKVKYYYTKGIAELASYDPVMQGLAKLSTTGLKELEVISARIYMSMGNSQKFDAKKGLADLDGWMSKFNAGTFYNLKGQSVAAAIDELEGEIRTVFRKDAADTSNGDLKAIAKTINDTLKTYTETLNGFYYGSSVAVKAHKDLVTVLAGSDTDAVTMSNRLREAYSLVTGSLKIAQIIEDSMKNFVGAAGDAIRAAKASDAGLKTEGFSQPIDINTTPGDVEPVVITADKPFLPESLVVTRLNDEDQLIILRNDKVRVRTNGDGLGEAIVVVDPALQGQIQANYEAVVSGDLPVMEDGEDPVVTLDVITDDRDGVEIRIAQMVDDATDEAIPEELVELRAEGVIALEAHENCIKGLSSMAYMVDMANNIKFEGDAAAAELVMEGMLDSIKGAMTRLGNWLDKSMKYQKVWDINWNKSLAQIQKEIRKAKGGTAKADVVKLNRVVRNLTINGAPVTDFRELQRQLAEIAKLGNDAKAHMVSVGNLYEDVRRLIAKHDNVNPDGAAILKEIPALVKKVNLRPWASMMKGERQVAEKSAERVPTSAPYLGDVVIAERQSINDLTYANPDKVLRAMLEKTYVGYRTDWELDRDLTGAETKVLTPQEMDALLTSLRKASEAWDLYSTIVETGKKMDAFYRSLWSLKQYDRDFLSAYGVIIAADQWAYHPVLDLRFDFAYPMQAVLRLISTNCAVYK